MMNKNCRFRPAGLVMGLSIWVLLASGCGQTGDLYPPDSPRAGVENVR
jgi:hypothetical protein